MADILDVSRRELLGAMARWSVPTVVTLTLGSKVLQAQASCPPCQRKQGTTCRACSISNMLNCQCEPCLGPPYCTSSSIVAPSSPSGLSAPGSQRLSQPGSGPTDRQNLLLQLQRQQRSRQQNDPFAQPLYRDPFGADRSPYGRPSQPSTGLYDRLRPDTLSRRRP